VIAKVQMVEFFSCMTVAQDEVCLREKLGEMHYVALVIMPLLLR
jgi:hypothetical protein